MSEQKICPTCGTEYPLSERFCPRDGSALRAQNAMGDLMGTIVAERYHILKKLGEGGMGQVYLAEHVKMGRKSALKVMNPGMTQDADAIARFNREASNASRLNHPNICAIYDFGETPDGLIYLAMEFIEGESLTSLVERNGALPAPRAASIIHQAGDALQVAHDAGIVHRDLKPDNIMIAKGRDGSDLVKVVDFGIAKASSSDAQKVTKTGLVVGTPEYMSPEQLAGDKLDGRSDLYSLGLVAFNCLTGKLPFPADSAQEAMIARLVEQPKTLAEIRPDIAWPAALQQVITKALTRDAAERYQSAAQFGREMAASVEGMPAVLAAAEGTMVMSAPSPAARTAAAPAVPPTRVASKGSTPADNAVVPAAKKGPPLAAIIGGIGVIAAAGIGVVMMKKPAAAPADTTAIIAPPGPSVTPSTAQPLANNDASKSAPPVQQLSTPMQPTGGAARTNGGGAAEAVDPLKRWLGVANDAEEVTASEAQQIITQLDPVAASATGDRKALAYVILGHAHAKLGQGDEACVVWKRGQRSGDGPNAKKSSGLVETFCQ
ncbi:MAG: serine/threonine protein kinase [Gemmatimonadaceae bacterium]|nr:serine/threonine protein kinase [Gemmatimonadaceae bacterium]